MTEFIASYNPQFHTGTVYCPEHEQEFNFILVDSNEWEIFAAYKDGAPMDIPPCFRPDPEILSALTLARVQNHAHTFVIK